MHLVFSTKSRFPSLISKWRDEFHAYLGGTVRGLGAVPEAVDGVEDHVHLLVSYKPTLTISDFVRELKEASSNWIGDRHVPRFAWQDGYSVFSVSASQRDRVTDYIANQAVHHTRKTFRDELVELLAKHAIEYDAAYLD